MTDYVIREDGMPEMFRASGDEPVNTQELLKNYPYLIKSMKEEKYFIKDPYCFAFDEIVYDSKVVGFATLEVHDMDVFVIAECYILPEFRGKGLFYNQVCKMNYISRRFGILQPTRKVVELLIDYSFAEKVDSNLVVSGVDFYFDNFGARSNKKDKIFADIPPSNFYDLSICSTVLVDNGEVFYHQQLECDEREYGKRKKLSKHYFKNIKKQLKKNKNRYNEIIESLKENLPKEKMTYEEFIGDGEGLSDFLQTIVDKEIISYERAVEIKEQIIDEYESGEIDDETLEDRVMSILVGEMDDRAAIDNLLNSPDDEPNIMKDLMDIVGDDEELGEEILDAIRRDDHDKFVELMQNAMDRDEEFNDNVYRLADEYDDEDDFEDYESDIDFESLGLNLNSPHPIAEMMWGPNDDKYKLDNTFYGKDYPISHDHHIYSTLKHLKEHNNLRLALAQANMPGSMTSQAVEMLLNEMELISNEVGYDNWDEFAHESLTVDDLKNILRKNHLRVSGKKQELIDRIAESGIPLSDFESDKYVITPMGEEFLKDSEWIGVYYYVLDKFDFNDYSKYLDEHEGEFKKVTLDYIEKHLKLAKKQKDKEYINDCIEAKDLLSSIKNI